MNSDSTEKAGSYIEKNISASQCRMCIWGILFFRFLELRILFYTHTPHYCYLHIYTTFSGFRKILKAVWSTAVSSYRLFRIGSSASRFFSHERIKRCQPSIVGKGQGPRPWSKRPFFERSSLVLILLNQIQTIRLKTTSKNVQWKYTNACMEMRSSSL